MLTELLAIVLHVGKAEFLEKSSAFAGAHVANVNLEVTAPFVIVIVILLVRMHT